MVRKKFNIRNKSGLHVRPASVLASACAKYTSDIQLHFDGGSYNAKSVINVLAASIKMGDDVEVSAEGADEQAAINEIARLVTEGFGEGIS